MIYSHVSTPGERIFEPWNGRWVAVSHPGILEDGFDLGWGVAAPVGHGGFPDNWFAGWKPVECGSNITALEARVAELGGALEGLMRAVSYRISFHERNGPHLTCSDGDFIRMDIFKSWSAELETARAALKREGWVR